MKAERYGGLWHDCGDQFEIESRGSGLGERAEFRRAGWRSLERTTRAPGVDIA